MRVAPQVFFAHCMRTTKAIASAMAESSNFDNWAYLAAGVALGFGLSRLTRTQSAVPARRAPKRCAGMCKLKKEMYDQYTQLHDHVGCA